MKNIKNGRVLIIADIHQNIDYAKRCLDLEIYDKVIFLGDWMDTLKKIDNKIFYSVKNTCLFINETFEKLGDKAIWCCGNHDIVYFASHLPNTSRVKDTGYYCSGWTINKAAKFNKHINPLWIKNNELCCKVGDYIVSHAGFNYDHLQPLVSEEESICKIHQKWEQEKQHFYQQPNHWIWAAGTSRKGIYRVGSPVWQDWDEEFTGIDHVKQIVGHSTYYSPGNSVRKKGNNFNIDSMQSCYALWENNELKIKWTKSPEK